MDQSSPRRLGFPSPRFPCGFQSKATISMASFPFLHVCPIQIHFRLLTCMDISVSSVLLLSSSFQITSGQWILKIFRKQGLKKVCSFEFVIFTTFQLVTSGGHKTQGVQNFDFSFYVDLYIKVSLSTFSYDIFRSITLFSHSSWKRRYLEH